MIEVDGYLHQSQENEVRDLKCQREIEKVGFIVFRFKDEEVLRYMNQVWEAIQRQIAVIEEKNK